MENQEPKNPLKKDISKSQVVLILLAIVFFPITIIWFVWKKTKWSKKTKIIVTAIVVIFTMIMIAAGNSSETTQKSNVPPVKNTATKKKEITPPEPVKEDKIKLKFTKPKEESIEVTVDEYEIAGSVASADVEVELIRKKPEGASEIITVDPEGKFSIEVTLQKENNVFEFVAKNGEEEQTISLLIFRKMSQEELRAELKTNAKKISYKELFRNIDEYIGDEIHYKGKVVQVIGDGKAFSSMLVSITKGSYGIWDDTVFVSNGDINTKKILEDDIIEFWGKVVGEKSYETVLGAAKTVPFLNANIVELVE